MKRYVCIGLMLLSCGAPSADEERDEVRAVVSGILDADNRADLEQVLSYYHSEAILLPPGKDEINGKDNIRRNYENIFASSSMTLAPEEQEIIVTNDLAIYKGRTKGKIIAKADSSVRTIDDKFIMILKEQDGKWKIRTLIWN